jgi:hypothetical protein
MDGMPKGLKITNHTGQVLYHSAWIAGVEYDEDEIEDQDYEEEEDGDDDSDYTNDSDDDDDQYNEMDPDEIAALAEPLALQSDDEDEAQGEVESQVNNEEEADEEPEEDDDPNPTSHCRTTTAACRQCPSNQIQTNFQTSRCFDTAPKSPTDSSSPTTAILD